MSYYRMADEGTLDGIHYVTVLDEGGNPMEYNIPVEDALARYPQLDHDYDIQARLEYLRGEIEAERISESEIIELQNLTEHIDPGDVVLLEWAGVPEFAEEES